MKKLSLVFIISMAALASQARAGSPHWNIPLSELAAEARVCIALRDVDSDTWLVHHPEQCAMPLSPCSTFKIPNAIIGLDSGVLSGPEHHKSWDGTEHSRKALNRDHDLDSAIFHSVVWYFQDVALDIGAERMQNALNEIEYGNADISGGQDRFWLSSTLKITAMQQVDFMAQLASGALPFDPATQQAVTDMMLQDYAMPDDFSGQLYGKTGSCVYEGDDHGWFTGFLRRDGTTTAFAVNLIGENKWGPDARRVAIRVLQAMQR